jgi:creatinine amidohydrolase
MESDAEILLRKLTRREFRQRMQGGELRACIIPIAAIEQHLEHLAMEQDWRSVCHIAESVALRLQPNVLVAEGLMVGVSEHHMKHPGTLTLSPGTFLAALSDLIDSMVRAGFTNILVLNGHGGNVVPCRSNWDQFLRRFQVNLHFLSYFETLNEQDAVDLMKSGTKIPTNLPGHAQEFETSFALASFPENVRSGALIDQPDPTPAMATAETGQQFIERIVDRVSSYVDDMINGKRIAEIPPFHP